MREIAMATLAASIDKACFSNSAINSRIFLGIHSSYLDYKSQNNPPHVSVLARRSRGLGDIGCGIPPTPTPVDFTVAGQVAHEIRTVVPSRPKNANENFAVHALRQESSAR